MTTSRAGITVTDDEAALKEILLCWSVVGRYSIADVPIQGGLWHPDTPDTRRDLEIVRDCGNEQYGDVTHWIEERTG